MKIMLNDTFRYEENSPILAHMMYLALQTPNTRHSKYPNQIAKFKGKTECLDRFERMSEMSEMSRKFDSQVSLRDNPRESLLLNT